MGETTTLHASLSLIVQGIFDAGTKVGPVSAYVAGEFGAGAGGDDRDCGVGVVAAGNSK